MKAIQLIKLFTLVSFFVLGAQVFAETQEACKEACNKKAKSVCLADTTQTGDKYNGCVSKQQDACESTSGCEYKESKTEIKEKNSECKQALKDYDDAMKKTDEECGHLNTSSNQECRNKAKRCAKDLDSFRSEESENEESENESAVSSVIKMIGEFGQTEKGSVAQANSCLIENDEKAAEKEERIDDKITKIREEILGLAGKATEVDKDLSEKQQEVEKERLKVEEDASETKHQNEIKKIEDIGRMQKNIMASEQKRRTNLIQIANLQNQIAKVSFEQQILNLSFSDALTAEHCENEDKKVLEVKAQLTGAIDPKSGKKIKLSAVLARALNKRLKLLRSTCYAIRVEQKKGEIINFTEKKRAIKQGIETLTTSNADEEKAIANEIKQMEDLKAKADEKEKAAIDAKFKKLDSLNKSVTDMKEYIEKKKKEFEATREVKEAQINKLFLDRQNVKARFTKVSSTVSTSGRAASVYVNQCCSSADKNKNHNECSRVLTDEPESKTRTRSSTAGKVK